MFEVARPRTNLRILSFRICDDHQQNVGALAMTHFLLHVSI